jgi:G3E family GTPase
MTMIQAHWPIAIVTGFLGSGKTTFIGRLLSDPDMADTLVVVNEFGEFGLDHHLIKAVTDNVILLSNGCLCCVIRQDLVQTLRDVYRSWLTGTIPSFRRVVIETTGLAEPAPLVASLGSHPLLTEVFALRSIATLVDAEYGVGRVVKSITSRNQICVADRLILSKCDLVDAEMVEVLQHRLAILNPHAPICRSDTPFVSDILFSQPAMRTIKSHLRCDQASDHIAGISSVLLRPERRLAWPAFQVWLNSLLIGFGSGVMRVKGQLTFEEHPTPLIIQAVHHTFYPIAEVALDTNAPVQDFLVIIFEGNIPARVVESFQLLQGPAELPLI